MSDKEAVSRILILRNNGVKLVIRRDHGHACVTRVFMVQGGREVLLHVFPEGYDVF